MYITKMTIGNLANAFAEFMDTPAAPFPPFTAPVEFKFDEQVNLLVGPNATGKSTLLTKLFERLAGGVEDVPAVCPWGTLEFATPTEWELRYDMQQSLAALNDMPLIAIPATRVPYIAGKPVQSALRNNTDRITVGGLSQPLDGAGINRLTDEMREEIERLYAKEKEELSKEFAALYPNSVGYDLDDYLMDSMKYDLAAQYFQYALDYSLECSKEICGDIITGNSAYNSTAVHRGLTEAGLPTVSASLEVATRFKTSDPAQKSTDAEPLHIQQLSAGTQGTLWWIRLIALTLLKAANYEQDWEQISAVLLIDEIENHLHPTWQRRVIPALLEHFPGLQIFATTHSPFVVAGLKAGQVHLLNRDTDGVITASTNTEDIVGWTADEILRTMMGVEDPTDEATAAAARELRQLRDAGPSVDERDEERRQARMQELRQKVDRDLLAGGPMAARRERFEQDFANALEKHRQAQSLNQDGG